MESKESLRDKLKDVIPGEVDDQIVDNAIDMVEQGGDKAQEGIDAVTERVNQAAEALKDAIPGTADDTVIDKIKSVFSGSDRNPFKG